MEVLLLTDVAGGYFCNNTALGREIEEGLPDLQKAFLSFSLPWGEVSGGGVIVLAWRGLALCMVPVAQAGCKGKVTHRTLC